MTLLEAMRLQLNPAEMLGLENKAQIVEVTNGQWLNTVISRLTQPENLETVTSGENFNAILRPYQEKGLAWLHYMKTLGLGACLADDMGLGKTIQVIALLNYIRSRKKEKTLLVIPASLYGNLD
jgi:non-specific serine/threonine protein kinase